MTSATVAGGTIVISHSGLRHPLAVDPRDVAWVAPRTEPRADEVVAARSVPYLDLGDPTSDVVIGLRQPLGIEDFATFASKRIRNLPGDAQRKGITVEAVGLHAGDDLPAFLAEVASAGALVAASPADALVDRFDPANFDQLAALHDAARRRARLRLGKRVASPAAGVVLYLGMGVVIWHGMAAFWIVYAFLLAASGLNVAADVRASRRPLAAEDLVLAPPLVGTSAVGTRTGVGGPPKG